MDGALSQGVCVLRSQGWWTHWQSALGEQISPELHCSALAGTWGLAQGWGSDAHHGA